MARYIVDSQIDNHEKYYFIREQESQDIVLLPSKYLMHKKRSKLSPNTIVIKRNHIMRPVMRI